MPTWCASTWSRQGYAEASSPRDATLIVTLDYGVDDGRERVVARPDPFYPGIRSAMAMAASAGPISAASAISAATAARSSGAGTIRSGAAATTSIPTRSTPPIVDLDIRRSADGQSVFEGLAQARSRTDELPVLVPNLIEAMFTGFPGNSGETVRITVMPEREGR